MLAEFRQILEDGDVHRAMAFWSMVAPGMPAPKDEGEARVVMHMARTAAESIAWRHRAYSHAWLAERGLPSRLPDALRPKAERMYPRVAEGVGVSVTARSALNKPAAAYIQQSVSDVVADVYASDRRPDASIVRVRMAEARARAVRELYG